MATTVAPGQGPIEVVGHWGPKSISESGSTSKQSSLSSSQQASQQTASGSSATYIPDYLESPILRSVAQYSASMAPQVYQWGMEQFNKNQGNIDTMMRNALSYASPQRIAAEMGQAQAGVMQGAEAGRQNAIRDLQSYGIDPSSGRYAALDQASRVASGAQAAAAGNQQRMATEAAGSAMQNQALQGSLANVQTGYGAANAANQFLGTAMALKFPPLGQTSTNVSQGTSAGSAQQTGETESSSGNKNIVNWARGGSIPDDSYGGEEPTQGGFVSSELSPSNGSKTDDVRARLNAGEFVIPKDVAAWKGQEFFYKLMAQARKTRAMAESENGTPATDAPITGYADQSEGEPQGYFWGGPLEVIGHWGPKSTSETGGRTRTTSDGSGGNIVEGMEGSREIENWARGGAIPSYQGGGDVLPARGTMVTPPAGEAPSALPMLRGTMATAPQQLAGGAPATVFNQLPARGTFVTPPSMAGGIPPVTGYGIGAR